VNDNFIIGVWFALDPPDEAYKIVKVKGFSICIHKVEKQEGVIC
jgi:hypothetical protein